MRFSMVKKFENREQKDNYLFVATELLTFRRAIPGSLSTSKIDKTHGSDESGTKTQENYGNITGKLAKQVTAHRDKVVKMG